MSLIHSLPNDEINIHILRQREELKHFVYQFGFLLLSSVDYASALALIRSPQYEEYL